MIEKKLGARLVKGQSVLPMGENVLCTFSCGNNVLNLGVDFANGVH